MLAISAVTAYLIASWPPTRLDTPLFSSGEWPELMSDFWTAQMPTWVYRHPVLGQIKLKDLWTIFAGVATQEIWTWVHSAHSPPLLYLDLLRSGNRLSRNVSIFLLTSGSDLPPNYTKYKVDIKTLIMQATYSDAGSVGSHNPGSQNSPLRREYPTDKMANNEILSHLSKVRMLQVPFANHFFETNSPGGSNVRCFWARHCCVEPLLRGLNSVW